MNDRNRPEVVRQARISLTFSSLNAPTQHVKAEIVSGKEQVLDARSRVLDAVG